MFEVPPLLVSGLSAAVETFRVVVEMMVCSAIAWLSTLLGLSTIACVTLGMSAGEVRNWLGTPRWFPERRPASAAARSRMV
jgi:hypothetical protein